MASVTTNSLINMGPNDTVVTGLTDVASQTSLEAVSGAVSGIATNVNTINTRTASIATINANVNTINTRTSTMANTQSSMNNVLNQTYSGVQQLISGGGGGGGNVILSGNICGSYDGNAPCVCGYINAQSCGTAVCGGISGMSGVAVSGYICSSGNVAVYGSIYNCDPNSMYPVVSGRIFRMSSTGAAICGGDSTTPTICGDVVNTGGSSSTAICGMVCGYINGDSMGTNATICGGINAFNSGTAVSGVIFSSCGVCVCGTIYNMDSMRSYNLPAICGCVLTCGDTAICGGDLYSATICGGITNSYACGQSMPTAGTAVCGNIYGNICGTICGTVCGDVYYGVCGNVTCGVSGYVCGYVGQGICGNGSTAVYGNICGGCSSDTWGMPTITGDIVNDSYAQTYQLTDYTVAICGNICGHICGSINGNVCGSINGMIYGPPSCGIYDTYSMTTLSQVTSGTFTDQYGNQHSGILFYAW